MQYTLPVANIIIPPVKQINISPFSVAPVEWIWVYAFTYLEIHTNKYFSIFDARMSACQVNAVDYHK